MELDDVISGVKPHVRTVRICLDGALEDERLRLEEQLARARQEDERIEDAATAPKAPQIAERIIDVQAKARESEVEFSFAAIGRRAWTDLIAKHPATDEQIQAARDMDVDPLDYDIDAFPVHAIAASLVEPKGVTVEKVKALEVALSEGQWRRLWNACFVANVGVGDVGESEAASVVLRRMRRNSKPASDSESPDPSS